MAFFYPTGAIKKERGKNILLEMRFFLAGSGDYMLIISSFSYCVPVGHSLGTFESHLIIFRNRSAAGSDFFAGG